MNRIKTQPRNKWQNTVEQLGFGFHTTDVPYWDETAYYSFTLDEVDNLEKATTTLWDLCLKAVQHVIDNKLYSKFHIPENYIPYIEKTSSFLFRNSFSVIASPGSLYSNSFSFL